MGSSTPSKDFRLGQFYKFVHKSWWPCAKSTNFGLEMAEWTRKVPFCPNFSNSFEPIYKHTEPKSRHTGLEEALIGSNPGNKNQIPVVYDNLPALW